MAKRRTRNIFAKRNKGKLLQIIGHNLLVSKRKGKGSNSSVISAVENVGCVTILYWLLLIISWSLILLYLFVSLLDPKNFSFFTLILFSLIPISLHLIKFFLKGIKEERAKKQESKSILEEKSLESNGVKDLQGVDLTETEIPLETTTTNRFVDGEISIKKAITDRVDKLESMARPKCGICNKWLKNDWEDKITSTQSTFKKNIFSVKGFFFTLFSLGLWVFVAILIDLIKRGSRYAINKFRCQCDLRG